VQASADAADGPLAGIVDWEHVAIAGHSAGAGTAVAAAGDPDLGAEIDGYLAMSPGTDDEPTLPDVPSVVMVGEIDGIVSPAESKELYAAAPAPKRWYEFANSGHLVFTDICEIGADQGGVLALASTFGIEVPERLQTLATDGCQAEATPPPEVWPAIRHLATANLRAMLGIDDPAVGLDAVDQFGDVEITTEHED
jgi:hypothetical protein